MSEKFEVNLSKYAEIIVHIGLNLQPGQSLLIVGSTISGVDIQLAPFTRLVAESAYKSGASLVDVIWWDPILELGRLRLAPRESFGRYPRWFGNAMVEHHQSADAFLVLYAEDPDMLAGFDPGLVGTRLGAMSATVEASRAYRSRNAINWSVASAPIPAWAAKVLPALPAPDREARLWQFIFETCRVFERDPVSAWRSHASDLSSRAVHLTHKAYSALRYSAPGTDLTVGLPQGHIWHGGQVVSETGIPFVPNLPTEEVFTLPHRSQAEGVVSATKPFVTSGNGIEGMVLTFSEGRVVHANARQGEAFLQELIRTDEGTSRLGEVALVPNSSAVSRLGVTFHNTLFDENASSHLALGSAYRFSLDRGPTATDEQFLQAGGNLSKLHEDFMVGSARLDVDGISQSGNAEPIMRAGEWAFEV